MSEILRVNQFSLTIASRSGDKLILDDLNLSIHDGEILGLIGKSGSGKSLFGLSIADLLYLIETKVSGNISYQSGDTYKNILELSARELMEYRRGFVSVIFQDALTSLNPAKTCGWQIDESIRFGQKKLAKQERYELVLQAIKDVELDDPDRIYASYPHELSGGQVQRIMIAMALVNQAKLIIADEPTSSLDQETERTIIELLKKLHNDIGFSLLFISHDVQLVKSFCHRIAIMEKGKLVEVKKTNDLFENPESVIAKELLSKRIGRPDDKEVSDQVLLEVNELSHFYQKRKSLFASSTKIHSLKEVSFSIYRSEILGLMGQSGSGKSTIAKILTGFEYPSEGELFINSENLLHLFKYSPKQIRQRIQIIFQNPFSSLNPLQSVRQSLSDVLVLHQGLTKQQANLEVKVLLEKVGLSDEYLNRYPSQMSGGQQQRISIARTLAVKPELLICDECVSALDTSTKYDILDLLASLRDNEGLTILFVSHDKDAISYICDRVLHLKDGQLIM